MTSTAGDTALLDVNVLVALAWPNHVGHAAAQAWFRTEATDGWATTPFTEAGFVRVSSNRAALPTATTPAVAIDMLGRMTALAGHAFWPDAVHRVVGDHVATPAVTGHRHVTDAHLVALCAEHRGRLVTFDRAIASLSPAAASRVTILGG